MIRSAQRSLSARSPSDRQSDHPGWNWHRSRSASPAGPHDGQRGWTCHHDAPARQRLPTRIQHAQVRFSWTSVHSSTKLPTSRNATQTAGQRSTTPLGQEEPEFHPASPSWPRSLLTPPQLHSAAGPMFLSRSRSKPEPSTPREWPLQRCDQGDYSQRLTRVPISSDQGHVFVDRDRHEPGLLLKNEIWRRTRQGTISLRRWISFSLGLSKIYQHPQPPSRKKAADHWFCDSCKGSLSRQHHGAGQEICIMSFS